MNAFNLTLILPKKKNGLNYFSVLNELQYHLNAKCDVIYERSLVAVECQSYLKAVASYQIILLSCKCGHFICYFLVFL